VVIYGILMFVCAYGAKKGLQHIGSVAWIVFIYVIASFYLALLLSVQETTFEALFPIWGPGKIEILKQSSLNITLFVDLYIIAILIPYLKSFKVFRKGVWIAFIYVIIHLTFAFIIYICLFDTELKEIGYPFHTAIRYLSFGNFLSNIETLFLPIWVMGAFIRFAALMYINAMMFGHLFKVKDFEFLIPSLAVIYLLIGSIPEAQINVSFIKSYIKVFVGPTFATLAILLWLIALIKGEFKHGKNKNS
jgi:spore germination protein KB